MAITLQQTSFTRCELHDRVTGDIGLRGSNLISETNDTLRWAQDIIRKTAQECHWYRRTVTVDSVADQAELSLPADAINLEYVAYDQLPLELITYDELQMGEPYWRQQGSGTPYAWYRRGATSYGLFPPPDASTADIIELTYTAIPAMPATGNDTFNFPTANEMLIESYCRYRASIKDATGEGGKRIDLYQKEYLSEMARFKQTVSDLGEGELWVLGGDVTLRRVDPFTLAVARAIVPDPY